MHRLFIEMRRGKYLNTAVKVKIYFMVGLNVAWCHCVLLFSSSSLFIFCLPCLMFIFSAVSPPLSRCLSSLWRPVWTLSIHFIFQHLWLCRTSLFFTCEFHLFPALLWPRITPPHPLPLFSIMNLYSSCLPLIHMHQLTPKPSFHSLMCTGVQVNENHYTGCQSLPGGVTHPPFTQC